jgi:adenine/guanine/hypoxanthine permease
MAYIVFVNPSILRETGMPFTAVVAATCLSAAFGSIMMGAYARYPIALAPGMGLNAYFTYTVVKGMGVPWQTALGAVFLSGVAFLILTLTGLRQLIIAAIPTELYSAVAAGVGLFIAFIGLQKSGLIVPDKATLVTIGNLRDPNTLLAIFGLLLIALLLAWRIRAAMLLGIAATTLTGALAGLVPWRPESYGFSAISATAFKLDLAATLKIGLVEIVFVFLFVDLFDNIGTLVAVTKRAGLIRPDGSIPKLNRILLADSTAMMVGAVAGTSPVTSYIESASGVAAGGRTGLTSIVVGILFLCTLFFAPVVKAIPTAATAPALVLVGALMMGALAEIEWSDPGAAIPAFLTLIMIPLSFSIANGLAFGITSHAVMKLVRGRAHRGDWLVYVLAILCVARFIYLA